MQPDNLAADIDTVLQLAKGHTWMAWAAVVAWIVVRVSKDDRAVKYVPLFIAPRWRAWAALIMGLVYGVLHKLAVGGTWGEAIVGGLVAGNSATLGHEFLVESLRQGRDIGMSKEDAPPPPPPQPPISIKPPPIAGAMLALGALLYIGHILSGCVRQPSKEAAQKAEEEAALLVNAQACREKALAAIKKGGSCEEKRDRVQEVTATDPDCVGLVPDAGLQLHCKDGGSYDQ